MQATEELRDSTDELNESGDKFLSLSQAAALIPGHGATRVHASTLTRWVIRGVRTSDGRRVRLRAVRFGRRWVTTRSWLDDFGAAQVPTFGDEAPPTRKDSSRDRAARAAGERLRLLGA